MLIILILLFSFSLFSQIEEIWYFKKEEGKSSRETLENALNLFKEKVKENPDSFIFRANLLKAIYFKGCYSGMEKEEAKGLFAFGKKVGEEGKEIFKKITKLEKLDKPEEIAQKGKDIKGVAEFFFWDSACWGQWALLYGKLKAAKEGAAKKILISAEVALILNEKMEDGGPHRVLGRLHHQTPKIPLITGWVSKDKALYHLNKAMEFGPDEIMNYWFLGELYLDLGQKDKAKEIFEKGMKLPVRENKEPADIENLKKIEENLKSLK